jgi:hypothetical protein
MKSIWRCYIVFILLQYSLQVFAAGTYSQCLIHYSKVNQSQLAYFSKITGSQFLEQKELGSFFINIGIHSEPEKIKFLENVLFNHSDKPSVFHLIGISGISELQIERLAKVAALNFPSFAKYYIGYFQLKSEASRFEVAKVLATKNFQDLSVGISYFSIKNQNYLFELAQAGLSNYRNSLSHYLINFIQSYIKLNIVDIDLNKKMAKLVLAKAPEASKFLKDVFKIKSTEDLQEMFEYISSLNPKVANEFFPHELQYENRWRLLSTFLIKNQLHTDEFFLSIPELKTQLGSIIPADTLSMIWDSVQKYEVGLRLLEESYKYFNLSNRDNKYHSLVPEKISSSIEVLRKSSGLNFSDQQINDLSSDTKGRFYELLLDIQNHIYFPFFKDIQVNEALFQKKKFSKILSYTEAVRSLLAISIQNSDKKIASVELLRFFKSANIDKLNEQNIDAVISLLKEETIKKAKIVLNDQSGIWNSENYNRLINNWGDLEPVWTLIARYNERKDTEGISVLKKIISHSLSDTFKSYKFMGDKSDQQFAYNQLDFLSNEQRGLWIKPQVIIREQSNDHLQSAEFKLIASVKSSDPKLLLTIGDIVPTSSCQNYKTGTHIEALPGYVIDANVQALVSYEINQNSFEVKDFQILQEWMKTRTINDLEVRFDGDQNQFAFINSGQMVKSKKLPRAYLRNIIKVGKTNLNEPVFFLEKSYLQNHPNLQQMTNQHQEIVNILNGEVSSQKSDIKVIKSRNPRGQYSDFHLDSMTNDYIVSEKQQMSLKQ